MLLALTTADGNVYSVEVNDSMELENLRALIEVETTIPAASQKLLFNGAELRDNAKTLAECGIKNGDILLVMNIAGQRASSSATSASASITNEQSQAEHIRLRLLQDPVQLRQLEQSNPALAAAARFDPPKFRHLLSEIHAEQVRAKRAQMEEMARLEADPMDVDAQRKIEEMITQSNIQNNMENAIEYNPEAFARVVMLYIDCKVNGRHVKAFVDSGAQTTIMSPECAEQCQIMRLCDKRFQGIAKGVGTAKILGRVHSATLELMGNDSTKNMHLQCSFTIMEGKDVDMLLGLDMLKRFQACIDLSKGVLRIGEFETTFLSEKDLPAKAKGEVEPSSPQKSTNNEKVSTQPAKTPVQQPAASQSVPTFPEESIQSLVTLGATRQQAIQVLGAANGNLDMAAGLLFSME